MAVESDAAGTDISCGRRSRLCDHRGGLDPRHPFQYRCHCRLCFCLDPSKPLRTADRRNGRSNIAENYLCILGRHLAGNLGRCRTRCMFGDLESRCEVTEPQTARRRCRNRHPGDVLFGDLVLSLAQFFRRQRTVRGYRKAKRPERDRLCIMRDGSHAFCAEPCSFISLKEYGVRAST